MVPKYAFLNDCFQQSVQLNKPMVRVPQGGLRQVLVICFLIISIFKSSEAQLGLSFEATFHCFPLYLYWDRLFLELSPLHGHPDLLKPIPLLARGFVKKGQVKGLEINVWTTLNSTIKQCSASLSFHFIDNIQFQVSWGVWFLEITNISCTGPSEATEPQQCTWAQHLCLPLPLFPGIFRNITTKATQEMGILKKKEYSLISKRQVCRTTGMQKALNTEKDMKPRSDVVRRSSCGRARGVGHVRKAGGL